MREYTEGAGEGDCIARSQSSDVTDEASSEWENGGGEKEEVGLQALESGESEGSGWGSSLVMAWTRRTRQELYRTRRRRTKRHRARIWCREADSRLRR